MCFLASQSGIKNFVSKLEWRHLSPFVIGLWLINSILTAEEAVAFQQVSPDRPNILWLSTEDIGPHLGCYGDLTAQTPNLDALAAKGMVYNIAWSNYPVCAPARTTIVTGMYACANGAGHMRCSRPLPEQVEMFPKLLRDAGYYCTNNSKTDYNHPVKGQVWDQSNNKATYANRPHQTDQPSPFFAVPPRGSI